MVFNPFITETVVRFTINFLKNAKFTNASPVDQGQPFTKGHHVSRFFVRQVTENNV